MEPSKQAANVVDVVVVGGGPGGSSAALVLGRARKRVLLCDAGPRRNAAAEHIHGFVTRDGTPPAEFRSVARAQLQPYGVAVREERVTKIAPGDGRFQVSLEKSGDVFARRVILATGVIDELPELPGLRDAWGRTAFQCPHCHGWERRDQVWGTLVTSPHLAEFALMLTGWTPKVVAFTHASFELEAEMSQRLAGAGVRVVTQPIRRLAVEAGGVLRGIELGDGSVVPLQVLFLKTRQHLPPLVKSLALDLTEAGYVRVSERQETSIPGIYAIGDLTTPAQAAMVAAHGGAVAAWTIVHSLNVLDPSPAR